MKKIILIILIFLVFLMFQTSALAVDIDIGTAATDRGEPLSPSTRIIITNPANLTGKITSVEIWAEVTMGSVEVATFFLVSGNNYSTRDYEAIGTVTSGAKRTFTVDLDVHIGDYIGIYYVTGNLSGEAGGGDNRWKTGDHIPCTNFLFSVSTAQASLYGTGVTVPDQVTNVQATDGTYTDRVRVTWNAAGEADKYYVWQGSSWVDVGDVLTWDHTGAPAPTITHGSATASDGSSTAHVALSNTGASANVGSSISYKVKAWNTAGYGAESASNSGHRGVGSLTYQWYRSNVDGDSGYGSISGATSSTYNDTAAPAPTITKGTITASDGTSTAHVVLDASGYSANIGAGRYYKCYHTATGAAPGYTGVNRGYRTVGALARQWQKSAADSDASYSNISGATSDPYNYTAAPAGSVPGAPTGLAATDGIHTDKVVLTWSNVSGGAGAGRYYRAMYTATGATTQYTAGNRGFRKAYASTNTQVKRDTTELGAIGSLATSYNDTGAATPTITPGTASASDGTSSDYVTLSITGESANVGTTHNYYVRTYNAAGWGNYCSANPGYRGVGALTYQWQRSAGDNDADYSNIDGATTDPYNDTGAPKNGDGRYYKCIENATGAAEQTTNADRGYRIAVGIVWNGITITKWNGITVTKINGK